MSSPKLFDQVAPPTPAEVQRKLSLHSASAASPVTPGARRRSVKKPISGVISGTESDSDGPSGSYFSPPQTTAAAELSSSPQPPLTAIVERRNASGEESDDDEEEGEEWHPAAPSDRKQFGDSNNKGNAIIKSGYLWKKGERRKNWKKRWFVLRTSQLAAYKNQKEYQLSRILDMRDVHSATVVSLKKHQNTFGMVTPSRTYYLEAESSEECHSWVKALNEVRIRLKEEDATPSAGTPLVQALTTLPAAAPTITAATPAAVTAKRSSISSTNRAPPPPSIITSPSATTFQGNQNLSAGQMPRTPISPLALSSDEDDPFTATIPHPIPTPTTDHPPYGFGATTPGALTTTHAHHASPPSSKGPSQIILTGYLMKCGSKRKTWRKRWFMLTSERLAYSKSHIDTKHTKHVTLDQFVDAIEYAPPSKHQHHHALHGKHSPESSAAAGAAAGSSMPVSTSGGQHSAPGGISTGHTVVPSGSLEKSVGVGGQPSSFGAASLGSESGNSAFSAVTATASASAGSAIPANTFKIITTQRPFLLSAPSEEEEIQWLSAVRALIARRP